MLDKNKKSVLTSALNVFAI